MRRGLSLALVVFVVGSAAVAGIGVATASGAPGTATDRTVGTPGTLAADDNGTLSGTLTDGATGEALSGVTVTVDDGDDVQTVQTDGSGTYSATVPNGSAVTVSATATVAGAEDSVEIAATSGTTVDGTATADLTLYPDLAGSGTQADPYQIGSARGLQAMSLDLDAHYRLVSDVNASRTVAWNGGKGFDPVGDSYAAGFTGTFDGDGNTITGMTIDRPTESNVGVFGSTNGDISNTTVREATVTGDKWVGGLAGDLYGSATEVSVSANVSGTDDVGGLVGYHSGSVDRSAVSGTVSGTDDVGGLVGSTGSGAAVTDSHAASTVNGGSTVGGLVGYLATSATVTDSYATGDVSGGSEVGGLIGKASSYSTVTDAYWDVDTTGQSYSGGDGTGLTTAEMTGIDATENMALDFGNTWAATTGYPALRWNDATAGPVFAVTSVDAPATVAANRTLTVDATVENVGATDGTTDVTLSFDGSEMATESVTVAAGATETVTLEGVVPAGTAPGDYDVTVESPDDGLTESTEVRPLRTVIGTVTDGVSGAAVGNATVTLAYASGGTETVRTDAIGRFTTEVVDGSEVTVTANVTADAVDDPRIDASETLTVDSDEFVRLELWPDLDGEGTEANPYEIANAYELQAIGLDAGANYTLVSDVDASGTDDWYATVGTESKGFLPVALDGGSLDGAGHAITDVTLFGDGSAAAGGYVGLFGTISDGRVSNLSVVNATLDASGGTYPGLFAASVYGGSTIANVSVSGSVTSNASRVGAIGRLGTGELRGVTADVDIDGTADTVGGLVGENRGVVRDSTAAGSVTGGSSVGGLVGVNDGTVSTSFATGAVTADAGDVGGLVGTDDDGTVQNAYWDVNATGQSTSASNATGLTTAQLTGVEPLSTMAGFDFENSWQLSTEYPQLKSSGVAPVGPLAIEGVETDAEVVKGETLAVNVTVENVGSVASDDRVTLTSDGETVNRTDPLALAPGENRTVSLAWTPEDVSTGEYALTVASASDDDSTAVQVVGVGTVEGTLTDDTTGAPIAGATVTVENGTYGPYDVTAGTDGSFVLAGVPEGDYDVSVEADGYHSESLTGLSIRDGDVTDLGARPLSGNASIGGIVEDAHSGTLLRNATVTVTNGNWTDTERTAADGTYTIEGVPGTGDDYRVTVDPVAAFRTSAATTVTVASNGTVTTDLAPDRVSTYFAVDRLDSPTSVDEGDDFTASATVTNLGGDRGNTTVEYLLDGTVVDTAQVSIDAGNGSTVSFEYAIDDTGTHSHGTRTVNETTTTDIDVEAAARGGGSGGGWDGGSGGENDDGDVSNTDDDTEETGPVNAETDGEGRATATVSVDVDETVRVDLGDIVVNSDAGVAITQVSLTFGDSAGDVTFTAETVPEPPATVSPLRDDGDDRRALSYVEMTTTVDGEDASERLDSATVRFTVQADRATELDIAPQDIVLYRFDGERHEWEELDTEVASTGDGRVVYNATTTQFSVFAVGGRAEAGGEPDGTPTTDGATSTPRPPTSTPQPPTSTAETPTSTEPTPSESSTTDPGTGSTNGGAPGFGVGVAVIALVSTTFFVRSRRT
ncbi:carboxypeptidase regulatory-like domain-containing protein [Haloarchaeobius salinus]|uniref:carboxypeptidase regulatory-like domain-containing protein n=1 Tax=Haloarchaeobius salinus TaxID=1198298 RepID=UPI0026E56534|nr:carboxypeptidase regulatory-like domain-containing protein [Haloarchaeobius salinus]